MMENLFIPLHNEVQTNSVYCAADRLATLLSEDKLYLADAVCFISTCHPLLLKKRKERRESIILYHSISTVFEVILLRKRLHSGELF